MAELNLASFGPSDNARNLPPAPAAAIHQAATVALCSLLTVLVMAIWPAQALAEDPVWTTDDFTYESYSDHFYGCDYSRQFDVAGNVISGSGKAGSRPDRSGHSRQGPGW